MQRRAFFKLFGNTIYLPFIQVCSARATPIDEGLLYSDSDGTAPVILTVLGDLVTDSGGVEYAA